MTRLRLFGTTTSPYVRRVRIVAAELGLETELVNTFEAQGQAALREASPVWKVPAAQLIDGGESELVLDSHTISEVLAHRFGPGPLAPFDPYDVPSRNWLSVIDGVLDSLINVFYLRRDNVDPADAEYMAKQIDRAAASLAWLEQRADELRQHAFGLVPIALLTTIDWIRFRETASLQPYPALVAAAASWNERPSVAETLPG